MIIAEVFPAFLRALCAFVVSPFSKLGEFAEAQVFEFNGGAFGL